MTDPEPEEIHYEVAASGVAVVTVDRPQARNAFGWRTWPQLTWALQRAERDDDVGAVVLTGANGVFSAGGDLKTFGRRGRGVLAPAARLRLVREAFVTLHRMSKPSIAAVESYAIGGGWSLALTCSLLVCGESAFFSAAFVARGFVPDTGSAWVLPRLVGPMRANDILLTGRRVNAAEAGRVGLVTETVPDGTALERAMAIGEQFATGPRDSLSLTLGLVRRGSLMSYEDFLEDEIQAVALNFSGVYATEGQNAFREKREPDFVGARERENPDG